MIANAWPKWARWRFRPRETLPATKNLSSSGKSLRTWLDGAVENGQLA